MKNLVLISGTLCDASLWQKQCALLKDDFNIFLPSISSYNDICALVSDMLADLPQKFSMVGMSAGAVVAFEVLRQAPVRVEKLCVIAANPFPVSPELLKSLDDLLKSVRIEGFSKVFREKLLTLSLDSSSRTKAIIEKIITMAEKFNMHDYENQIQMLKSRGNGLEVLSKTDIPVLAVCGESDQICPVELHKSIVYTAKKSSLIVLKNTGHYVNLENPDGLNSALVSFL